VKPEPVKCKQIVGELSEFTSQILGSLEEFDARTQSCLTQNDADLALLYQKKQEQLDSLREMKKYANCFTAIEQLTEAIDTQICSLEHARDQA
jgi:hypothetical protein